MHDQEDVYRSDRQEKSNTPKCNQGRSTEIRTTCCSGASCTNPSPTDKDAILDSSDDVERGPTVTEHITLTILGLKCGCCDVGLSKALRRIKAIQNAQVNVVLARVEFDLDTGRRSVQEIISDLQQATGYTFEQYEQPDGQVLELQVPDTEDLRQAGRPYGVTALEYGQKQHWRSSMLAHRWSSSAFLLRKDVKSSDGSQEPKTAKMSSVASSPRIIQVHYDAKLIGAREVFEYYQGLMPLGALELTPADAHVGLDVNSEQMKHEWVMFVISAAFTIPVLILAWAPLNHNNAAYWHVSLALATIVQVLALKEFVPGAWQSLIHARVVEMDALIALSTTMAYVFSLVAYVFQLRNQPLETGSFFETSTLLVTLILLGRAISEMARYRAAKSVSVRSLQVSDALLVSSSLSNLSLSQPRQIDARLLQYGDRFQVLPHSRIVTDGLVVYGGSEVDESMITGESIPVAKGLGKEVHAGTMNGSGMLIVSLTKLPHENAISRIATMVENAGITKPKTQALADVIAGWFVLVIASIGTIVFLIWILVEHFEYGQNWTQAIVKAITYAIATLIVSCPCAIGLAVPMVVLMAGGMAARFGIIFRDPQKLEVARSVTDIVFDKTGTLTSGELAVADATFQGDDALITRRMTLGLLAGDQHPVAVAVCRWLKAESEMAEDIDISPMGAIGVKSEPGNGVVGICDKNKLEIRAGNPQWVGVKVLESEHTVLCVTISGVLRATFRLHDEARHNAYEVIKLLKRRGLKIHLCSGDGEGAVNRIAHTLDIAKSQTKCTLKPEDKQKYIRDLQADGRVVMFCGDGTNDSVALKQADVGVHINHGSDMAKGASDVVLMAPQLQDILILLDISAAAYRRILLNFTWSAIYNIIAVLMAAGAFVKVRIPPAYAGLGELVSVLPIVFIAFQLRLRDYGARYRALASE